MYSFPKVNVVHLLFQTARQRHSDIQVPSIRHRHARRNRPSPREPTRFLVPRAAVPRARARDSMKSCDFSEGMRNARNAGPAGPTGQCRSKSRSTFLSGPIRCRSSSGVIWTASANLRKLSVNIPCSPGCMRRKKPDRFMPTSCANASCDINDSRHSTASRSPEIFIVLDVRSISPVNTSS